MSTAQAQTPHHQVSPQFRAFLQAQQHRAAVIEAAKHSTTWIRHDCQSGSFTPLGMRVWNWPRFNATGVPVAGAWGESVRATGCGFTRVLNVVTIVRSPGSLVTGPIAPGNTSADPALQRDASRYAFVKALSHMPECRQAFLDNTKIVRNHVPASSDARLTGPVHVEDWMIVACGQPVTVQLQFLPDATGTTIIAH